ncbi:MAG TPA: VanZ family protein [Acetivibrio sp.]|nr:VanZ family protein [Clostridium sp.]HOQ37894.1 VanZ family protein [Acetivibrio sp.]HPT91703.1 VanZ family protein [Acetivibrio sp.]HQA58385.1 VanZ family protein [Acetivibrio sp.]
MSNSLKVIIDFIVLAILYAVVFFRKWRTKGKAKLVVNTLMYIYISLVLYVTLMPIVVSLPFIFNHPYVSMNMIPFDDYFSGRGDAVRQIVLNVIMMVPFGFLLPLVRKQNVLSSLLWTFLFSLGIELTQPLINGFRTADITDLITNTMGGLLGYFLYLLFKPVINKIISHLK